MRVALVTRATMILGMTVLTCLGSVARAGEATDLPPLPPHVAVAATEQLQWNGVLFTVHELSTPLSRDELASAFREFWSTAVSSSVAPETTSGEWHVLGHQQRRWYETLQIRNGSDGAAEARLATFDLLSRPSRVPRLPATVPPETVLVSTVQFPRQPGAVQWLMHSRLPVAQLARAFDARLLAVGWRAIARAGGELALGAAQSYQRGRDTLTITVSARAAHGDRDPGSSLVAFLARAPHTP